MGVKYSCFISYPHSEQSELWESIIMQLKKALKDQISVYMEEGVYLDEDRLKPGYSHKESLARAICESVCMIVVYSPLLYQKSDYCLREFLAMERIEEKRAKLLGQEYTGEHRMIIPIIIKQLPGQPLHVKIRAIKYWDLSKYILLGFKLDEIEECKKMIREVADVILEHYSMVIKCKEMDNIDCSDSPLPTVPDAIANWSGESPKPPPLPFH